MASGDLYEVERIVGKRKNRKGKWEYLIRWKGYGQSEDTWEPKHHLRHCEEFIRQFNGTHGHKERRSRQRPLCGSGEAVKQPHRKRALFPQKQRAVSGTKPGKGGASSTHKTAASGAQLVSTGKSLTAVENGDVGQQDYAAVVQVPQDQKSNEKINEKLKGANVTHSSVTRESDTGYTLANGGVTLQSSGKRKMSDEKGSMLDKRLRYSVRHTESNGRFRDIVVRREDGFTHILLSSQTSDNNALTPEIMKEVTKALVNAATDDSKLLLLSAVGSVFCSGLDHSYLIGRLTTDRKKESIRIAESIRDFVKAFIQFKKPIVVAVNGPALGLGASILPLCDIVWASEKACFHMPYATICLTPTGCSSYTFPQILGVSLANDMLFCGRKLTAQEACSRGLVSQVFWPTTFSQELIVRVKEMAACNSVVLQESKCLVRSFLTSVLEEVNERECQMLKQLWSTTKGLDSIFTYLQDKICQF